MVDLRYMNTCVDLASGIDESIPVYLLQKTSDEIRVKIGDSESYLDVFELEREIV